MTKDRLCKLSEHLGGSNSWPLVLSILLTGLSGGRRG